MDPIDPWIHCQQIPSQQSDNCKTATFASWNANALLPHVQQIAAMDFQVMAMQEVRIPAEALDSARKTIAKLGFNLVVGALPSYKTSGFNRKSTRIDQTIPGVGFLIREDVPYQEISLPAMQQWIDKGRFLAIKAFINNRWVYCFAAYAPVMETEPFLDDVANLLQDYTAECCIIGMDANSNTQNGSFVHSMHSFGWLPLTMCTSYDFTTYHHPNGSTSCIDTIIVSPLLQDHVAQIETNQILEKGHACLSVQIAHNPKQKPTWEIYHKIAFSVCEKSQACWEDVFEAHKKKISATTVEDDWNIWCQAFAHIHTQEQCQIGGLPVFRTRDSHKTNRCLFQLCQAINQQNFVKQKSLLDQIKKLNLNQVRKWRNKLQLKLLTPAGTCFNGSKPLRHQCLPVLPAKILELRDIQLVYTIPFVKLMHTSRKSTSLQALTKFLKIKLLSDLDGNLMRIWLLLTIKFFLKSLRRLMSTKLLEWMDLRSVSLSNSLLQLIIFLLVSFVKPLACISPLKPGYIAK